MIYIFISIGILFSAFQQNEFRGTIIYDSYSMDKLIGEEILYFGDQKLRIDTRTFYSDTILNSSKIYLFEEHPNIVFVERNGKYIRSPYTGLTGLEKHDLDVERHENISGYDCTQSLLKGFKTWGGEYKHELLQQIWCSDKLLFSIQENCEIPESVISPFSRSIILKMNLSGSTPLGKNYSISKIARNIDAKPVSDVIFAIK